MPETSKIPTELLGGPRTAVMKAEMETERLAAANAG
jgi:hypothetical protein